MSGHVLKVTQQELYLRGLKFSQGKDKVVPALNYAPCHKDVLGSGGIAPRIL
jgi:hypothetical protein